MFYKVKQEMSLKKTNGVRLNKKCLLKKTNGVGLKIEENITQGLSTCT